HAQFRFDLRYRALTGASRRGLAEDVEQDFPTLPAGCHIELDPVAKQIVLDNLRRSLAVRRRDLTHELTRLGDISLSDFLAETGIELEEIYRTQMHGGWVGLRRDAGIEPTPPGPYERQLTKAISRILHVDDPGRLGQLRRIAAGDELLSGRLTTMLQFALWDTAPSEFAQRLPQIPDDPSRCDEPRQALDLLHARLHPITP